MFIEGKHYIVNANGCHIWQRSKDKGGYGRFRTGGVEYRAHRYALMQALGRPLGDGLVARHTCDTPACVNPEHLLEGTQRENLEDCRSRGRLFRPGGNHKPLKSRKTRLEILTGYFERGVSPKATARLMKVCPKWVSTKYAEWLNKNSL